MWIVPKLRLKSPRPPGLFYPGDVYKCSTRSDGHSKQTYKWTDSNGVIVSSTSRTELNGSGWFNLTCTVTDQRPKCIAVSASISGHINRKFISLVFIRCAWLRTVMVRASDLQSRGCEFDSQLRAAG